VLPRNVQKEDRGGGSVSPPSKYTVGGTVSGLAQGNSVTLQNNGGDTRTVSSNASFTFATAIAFGSAYSVSVSGQPAEHRDLREWWRGRTVRFRSYSSVSPLGHADHLAHRFGEGADAAEFPAGEKAESGSISFSRLGCNSPVRSSTG
jgi:hypothetical protein